MKPAAVQKKNFLFVGNTGGGHTWAIVLSLTQTCKLNGVDPQAYRKRRERATAADG